MSKLADTILMSGRTKPLTIAFYLAFAVWFIAMIYVGTGLYRWLIHPYAQIVFNGALWVTFIAIVVAVARRSLRLASIPWIDLVVFGCALVALDLFWRFYLSLHAWDAYKITSVMADAAAPIICGIGIVAFVGEWRRV
ncbi:hypothetical protein [Aurantiacibacter flavus]|uniref:Uncharacterized protein n=1 Tax=Aurantiacibacter flavus TaxID=3145232 RepID=A0ABV0CU07_9SPHN